MKLCSPLLPPVKLNKVPVHAQCHLLGAPTHVDTYCMHPEHKASVLYKTAELSMSHSMDTTDFFKVAHSLSNVHSLSLAAANEQVSRQWLHHQQVIDQRFRLLLAMCTCWHN